MYLCYNISYQTTTIPKGDIMSVYHIVFSPTGGTKKVSDIFTASFSSESILIDLTERSRDFSSCSFAETDTCIVSVPSYGGRVPDIAVTRLRQMNGNGASAILIAVYGNRAYDDTFAELQDVLADSGFSCIAAVAAVAEHSIMRQYAAGRPNAQDAETLTRFAENIRAKMEAGSLSSHLNLPGNRPYREYGGVPLKPAAGKSCNRCGLCADKCPTGAIDTATPSQTDPKLCISCMRCMAICPQHARSLNKALHAAASLKLKKACSSRKENELFL